MGILLSLFRATLLKLPLDYILVCKPVWLKLCQDISFKEKYLQNVFSSYGSSEHQGKSSFWKWADSVSHNCSIFCLKWQLFWKGIVMDCVWNFGGSVISLRFGKWRVGGGGVEMTALCVCSPIVTRTLLSWMLPPVWSGIIWGKLGAASTNGPHASIPSSSTLIPELI